MDFAEHDTAVEVYDLGAGDTDITLTVESSIQSVVKRRMSVSNTMTALRDSAR